jgi:hypothetical protein
MNPFHNDSILAEKQLNMLPITDNSTSYSIPINFSKNITHCPSAKVNPASKYLPAEKRLSLTKIYSCPDPPNSVVLITPKQFADSIAKNSNLHERKCIPIIDCRSQIDFGSERIRSSYNISCRTKLMARKLTSKCLEEVEPNLSVIINNSDFVILYDQSTDVRGEDKLRSLPIYLVVQAAKRSNKKVHIIQGMKKKTKYKKHIY